MSRFVSAGAEDNPAEQDEEWQKAYAAIEATRQNKNTSAMAGGSQEGGKSLYETLQANKAAKQEAFEESLKLSNQFQSLNEDEVEFLDSVMESTRAQEAALRKETTEQLDAFRRQQEEAERAAKQAASPGPPDTAEQESWSVGKKRKKGKESLFGAVKLRRSSTTDKSEQPAAEPPETTESSKTRAAGNASAQHAVKAESAEKSSDSASPVVSDGKAAVKPASSGVGLGLAAYSSDEDD